MSTYAEMHLAFRDGTVVTIHNDDHNYSLLGGRLKLKRASYIDVTSDNRFVIRWVDKNVIEALRDAQVLRPYETETICDDFCNCFTAKRAAETFEVLLLEMHYLKVRPVDKYCVHPSGRLFFAQSSCPLQGWGEWPE